MYCETSFQPGKKAWKLLALIRASLGGYTAPPLCRTILSSSANTFGVFEPPYAKSSARVNPDLGQDSMPGDWIAPSLLSAGRKEPSPDQRMRPSSSLIASLAVAKGTTMC